MRIERHRVFFDSAYLPKFPEHRFSDCSPAIVRAKVAIWYDHDPGISLLDQRLARRHDDAEVHDEGLRPVLEACGQQVEVLLVTKVETTFLGRAAGANEPVLN